jgi:hypothetical protein
MFLRFQFLFSSLRALAVGIMALLFLVTGAQAQSLDQMRDEMRALAHSRLAVQVLLNQGADLLYGPARRALEDQAPEGFRAFGGMSGSRQEVSGSGKTKVDGFSFMAGLGRRFNIDDSLFSSFTYGFFGEGGTGSFETSRNFDTGFAKGEGSARYVGGGFILKAELQNNVYTDGAFRVGQAVTDLDTLAFHGNADAPKTSSLYLNASGTLGWKAPLNDLLDLDVYGRLLWNRQESGEKRNIGGNLIKIADVNSTRTIFGARADFKLGEGRLVYAGAAWEHEFNGRAELLANSRPMPGPFADLEGDSLLGEVGLTLAGENGFSASFGLEGALGQREALGGVLRLGYEF